MLVQISFHTRRIFDFGRNLFRIRARRDKFVFSKSGRRARTRPVGDSLADELFSLPVAAGRRRGQCLGESRGAIGRHRHEQLEMRLASSRSHKSFQRNFGAGITFHSRQMVQLRRGGRRHPRAYSPVRFRQ